MERKGIPRGQPQRDPQRGQPPVVYVLPQPTQAKANTGMGIFGWMLTFLAMLVGLGAAATIGGSVLACQPLEWCTRTTTEVAPGAQPTISPWTPPASTAAPGEMEVTEGEMELSPLPTMPASEPVNTEQNASDVREASVTEPTQPAPTGVPVVEATPVEAQTDMVIVEKDDGRVTGSFGGDVPEVQPQPVSTYTATTEMGEYTIEVFDVAPTPLPEGGVESEPTPQPTRTSASYDGYAENQDGSPVMGATATLEGVGTVQTDSAGYFRFEDVPEGYHNFSLVFERLAEGDCLVATSEYAMAGSTGYHTLKPDQCP